MKRLLLSLVLLSSLAGGLCAVAAPHLRPTQPRTEDKPLVVFPNPSTGLVHLTINGQEGKKLELQILNVIGSVVYRETLTELNAHFTRTLDLSRFVNGLYYVKLEGEGVTQISKLVIR